MPTDPVNAVQGVYDKTSNQQNVETAKYRYDRRSKILKFENNVEKDRKNIENIELFQFIVMKAFNRNVRNIISDSMQVL